MEDLKNILRELLSYRNKEFNPSDDAILEVSKDIFLSQKVSGFEHKEEKSVKEPNKPATDKQKELLNNLKIKYPSTITRGEAHQIIKEKLNKKKEEDFEGYL